MGKVENIEDIKRRRSQRTSDKRNVSRGNNVSNIRRNSKENPERISREKVRDNAKARQSYLKKKQKEGSFDFILFFTIIVLLLFGLMMIFSSSYYYTLTRTKFDNDMYYFVKKQIIFGAGGFIGMLGVSKFNYRGFKNLTKIGYAFVIITLVLVLLIGVSANGSQRWIGLPNSSIGFQPSEVAKFVVIVCLAHYISANKDCLSSFSGFIKCCMIWLIPSALVAVENLSTAIVIAGISVIIMFVASPVIWYFVVIGAVGVGGIAAMLLLPDFAYRIDRITYWLDPFSDPTGGGLQIIQGLYAVASGGLFGLGLGQSRQKTYVPEPYNDMIFAIICEELGMVGAILVILLFAVFVWRGVKIAMNAQDMFGCLIATGLVALIGIQVIINVAVATNTMPNTGMQLPFISYGGSGLVFTLLGMGILLNISKFQKNNNK